MVNKIKRFFRNKRIRIPRTTILALVFILMSVVLVRRIFELQIIQGEEFTSDFTSRTTKTRTIKSTRGTMIPTGRKT